MRVSAIERKRQLIAATIELMRREGVQSVTIRAIAKEADAPLAAAHYCFSSKDELMQAAAEAWFMHMSRFSSDIPVDLGLRHAVNEVASAYWRSLEEDPDSLLAQLELILWSTRNAATSSLAGKIYPDYEVGLGGLFASAADANGDQCQMDFGELTRAFLMVFEGAAIQYLTDTQDPKHRSHFFMLVDALLLKAGV